MSNPLPHGWRGESPQRGRSLADTGQDYADKSWLRTERVPFVVRALDLAFRMGIVLLIVLVFAWIIGANEARAQGLFAVLLENSMDAATLDECQRAYPKRPRPSGVVSRQNGTGTPWHHRTCLYRT